MFAQLSDSLVLSVLVQLAPSSKRSARLVCNRFKVILNQTIVRLRATLCGDDEDDPDTATDLHKAFPSVTMLILSCSHNSGTTWSKERAQHVIDNKQFMAQLKTVKFETDNGLLVACYLRRVCASAPLLEKLDVQHPIEHVSWTKPALLSTLEHLQELDLGLLFASQQQQSCGVLAVSSLVGLTKLRFNGRFACDVPKVLAALASMPSLQELGIHSIRQGSDTHFKAIGELTRLTALALHFMDDVEISLAFIAAQQFGLKQLQRLPPSLRKLQLDFDTWACPQLLDALQDLPCLSELEIAVDEDSRSGNSYVGPAVQPLTRLSHLRLDCYLTGCPWLRPLQDNLQNLDLRLPAISDLKTVVTLTKLTSLALLISVPDVGDDAADALQKLSRLRNLQDLQLANTVVHRDGQCFGGCLGALAKLTGLTRLTLSGLKEILEEVPDQPQGFPALREVRAVVWGMGSADLEAMCSTWRQVTRLELGGLARDSNCPQKINARNLARAFKQLASLRNLCLWSADLDDLCCVRIAKLWQLTEITLQSCYGTKRDGMLALIGMPALRVLRVRKCQPWSDECLESLCLAYNRPHLVPLDWFEPLEFRLPPDRMRKVTAAIKHTWDPSYFENADDSDFERGYTSD